MTFPPAASDTPRGPRSPRLSIGNFFIDEEVLRETGLTDFTQFRFDPKKEPALDLFVD